MALIVGMQPLLTAVIGRIVLGERLSRLQLWGLWVGFLGVWMVLWDRIQLASISAVGLALAILALTSITFGTVYQKRFCTGMDLWTGSVVQFASTASVLLPFALATESMRISWSAEFVFALGWLVLVLSIGAISLLHLLIKRGAATRVAALFYLTPATTALFAFLAFEEQLTTLAVAGMAFAAFGVWLTVRRQR